LKFEVELYYDITSLDCDFIFNFHAAQTRYQTVVHESLSISQPVQPQFYTDAVTHTRYMRLRASAGALTLRYSAVVDVRHHATDPLHLSEVPIAALPGAVLSYLYPSRYCPSDLLYRLAVREFGHLPQGYSRVQAICDWVRQHVSYCSNTSDHNTTAVDTLIEGVGVCRDFAHLMISLCRAVNIPARFTTGVNYGVDPAVSLPDFHAYVEVYLGGRWYIFDPSGTAIPMGMMRLATGRDAADSAFSTMFGGVTGAAPVIRVVAIPNGRGVLALPAHTLQAISTDAQPMLSSS
jgi:transglutaminase-like putative cysteine protease